MADTEFSTPSTPAPVPTGLSTSRVDRSSRPAPAPSEGSSSGGKTTIADGVVAKVAGIAAREVRGVYALGGGGARALGAIRNVINADDLSQGVKVEVGDTQAAADITIVVEYPMPIQEVASGVRSAVSSAISTLVGLQVVEVNVAVNDVHLPSDDDDKDTESRVS
ncbi:Asp23/Gls24 family envelope stress response protein [Glaciibacter flavus]|uniref:Asp23/Gls24 family envelope stress response protein n=1 Tax=Orlajensenia flava TaxID=2565934 RepID=A0A4V6RZ07_9MICO|nr:Asp23/Gls24 family envelope stress response protein [Glaciibacter flavus]THG30347.1 Asp23/Gls24 family envelope stress response protein [Glaciibacter flavus]THG30610.1 Asp23/Gls24 family envelope stress response protein [Glaciibacter flavus]